MSMSSQALMKDVPCTELKANVCVNSIVNFGEFPGGVVGRQSINPHDFDNYKEMKHLLFSVPRFLLWLYEQGNRKGKHVCVNPLMHFQTWLEIPVSNFLQWKGKFFCLNPDLELQFAFPLQSEGNSSKLVEQTCAPDNTVFFVVIDI